MKISLFVLFGLSMISILSSKEYLDLNFYIQPKFQDIDKIEFSRKNTMNDSIEQVNFFGGKILKNVRSDSTVLAFLDSVNCHYACPTDYFFYEGDRSLHFKILSANIKNDTLPIRENVIIRKDSFSVGIFAIYSPDFTVKNKVNQAIEFDFDIFATARRQAEILSREVDIIIMLSNATKFIDNDIVQNLPIDYVISFDYQKKRNELLSNRKSRFFSILSDRGKFGKLSFIYEKGKLSDKWNKVNIR